MSNDESQIKKVLIVDDHPIVRWGVVRLLAGEKDFFVCGEAEDTDEALEKIEQTKPDVVVLDLSLKNSSGIDLIKIAKGRFHYPFHMLVMSIYEEAILVERAIRAGARGYIVKSEASEHLIAAIRSVLDGKFYLSERTKEQTLRSEFSGAHDDAMFSLSDRELETFQLIGDGMSTTDIAKNLHLNIKTVEGYRANIREKLDLRDNMTLVRRAMLWGRESQAA